MTASHFSIGLQWHTAPERAYLQQLAEHGLQVDAAVQHELRIDDFERQHGIDIDTGIIARDDVEPGKIEHGILQQSMGMHYAEHIG
jgi:hypothetical protein